MANNQPIYNSNDLLVRKAVAASGIVKLAVKLSKQARRGSLDFEQQKILEMIIAQFQCIECYGALETSAMAIFRPLGNTGADETTTLTINSVVVSNSFIVSNDNNATAIRIADAINDFTSVPNYNAIVVGNEVHITANDKGSASNGFAVSYTSVSGNVTEESVNFYGGQDGVTEEDNCLSENQMHKIFDNIANATECAYAPVGHKYE